VFSGQTKEQRQQQAKLLAVVARAGGGGGGRASGARTRPRHEGGEAECEPLLALARPQELANVWLLAAVDKETADADLRGCTELLADQAGLKDNLAHRLRGHLARLSTATSAAAAGVIDYATRLDLIKVFVEHITASGPVTVRASLRNLRLVINACRKETPTVDALYTGFVSEVLKMIMESCARDIYNKAESNEAYFYPQLMKQLLGEANLLIFALPSVFLSLDKLGFEADTYLSRILKKEVFGLFFERFSYCTCKEHQHACLPSTADASLALPLINIRVTKFAEALEQGGARLRAFVVHALVVQYLGPGLRQEPSFFCLLQLVTLLVKLLNANAVDACAAIKADAGVRVRAAGGLTPRADAMELRGAELYWLVLPMAEVLAALVERTETPRLLARGDLYMAIKSTAASLRKIWLQAGHRGPRCSQRRAVLAALVRFVALHCIHDVFHAVCGK